MRYAFNLNWDDLDENLKELKINEVIEYGWYNNEYLNNEGEQIFKTVDDAIEDSENRKNTERHIEAYFPMYF